MELIVKVLEWQISGGVICFRVHHVASDQLEIEQIHQ